MTFYEELGVPPDASIETIRDAYRKMARVLHPDAQTDPALKESSEERMKRINHLYGVLSDPTLRRRYDRELAGVNFILPPERQHRNHSGTWVWLAAIAFSGACILWFAGRESASGPVVYRAAPAGPDASAVGTPPAPRRTRTAPSQLVQAPPAQDNDLAVLRGKLLAADTDRVQQRKPVAKGSDIANLTPSALLPVATEVSLPAALPAAVPRSRWTGAWTYRQSGADNRNKALLPPEFIEAVINEDEGRMRGEYHARFKVAGSGISPDVDFQFEGRVNGPAGRLRWTGTGSAKGEVRLRLLSDSALEIDWSATDLGTSMGLASGTAVLNRKN